MLRHLYAGYGEIKQIGEIGLGYQTIMLCPTVLLKCRTRKAEKVMAEPVSPVCSSFIHVIIKSRKVQQVKFSITHKLQLLTFGCMSFHFLKNKIILHIRFYAVFF